MGDRGGRRAAGQGAAGHTVGTLVAEGEADLGFQQLSELIHVQGIVVLGPLPPEIQNVTVFAAGVASTSRQPQETAALIAYLALAGNGRG
ncbi:MAG: substrate-binding domain-containing protein [Caulobacteraceae bacterium]